MLLQSSYYIKYLTQNGLDLNVTFKAINRLEENTGEKLCGLRTQKELIMKKLTN